MMRRFLVGLLAVIAISTPALAWYPGNFLFSNPAKQYIVTSGGGFSVGACLKAGDANGTLSASGNGNCGFGSQQSIASTTTTDIGSTGVTNNVLITGTTTITGLGSSASLNAPIWFVEFNGQLTLTNNNVTLQLPGQANITTHQGDGAVFLYLGGGNWTCLLYQKATSPPGGGGGGFGTQTSIASNGTTDLGTIGSSNNALVTGTTTITSFGSSAVTTSPVWLVQFQSSLTLTNNNVSLILPGGSNIVTQANDSALALYLGSGNWDVLAYFRATTSVPVLHSKTFVANGTFTFPAGTAANTPFAIIAIGGGGGGGSNSGGSGGAGAGGGAGCAADYVISGFQAAQNATVTVGAGGVGSTNSASPGGNGAASTFVYNAATVLSAGGGTGGNGGGNIGAAGACTTNTTGLTVVDTVASGIAQNGGAGAYVGNNQAIGGAGGSNPMGQGGQTNIGAVGGNNIPGQNGSGYGGGGAGGESGGGQSTGGSGSSGAVIVQWLQ